MSSSCAYVLHCLDHLIFRGNQRVEIMNVDAAIFTEVAGHIRDLDFFLSLLDEVSYRLIINLVTPVQVQFSQIEGIGFFSDNSEGISRDTRAELEAQHSQLRGSED